MTKVLFVGLAESSHTASWIDLLDGSSIEFALFALPTGALPASKTIPTYMADRRARRGAHNFNLLNLSKRSAFTLSVLCLHVALSKYLRRIVKVFYRVVLRRVKHQNGYTEHDSLLKFQLGSFIRTYQPKIVHTLGVFPSADLFLSIADEFPDIIWVAHVRGGPDLELSVFDPTKKKTIQFVLERAQRIICDSESNYQLAEELGANREKFTFGVVSGSGGLDFDRCVLESNKLVEKLVSRRVVWPKVYESITSKAAPVIEAINLAWDDIQPATFTLLWLEDPDLELWIKGYLRPEILTSIDIRKRVTRSEALDLIKSAQVLLAPSLMDGVPNVMLESMMLGTVPIVSPIPTIRSLVSDPENVIFARNLYPEEIASALIRALNDSDGNNRRVAANRELVQSRYDRVDIKNRLIQMYDQLETF
jgi:glycosyltransferase involved in cell wall biosynthesis